MRPLKMLLIKQTLTWFCLFPTRSFHLEFIHKNLRSGGGFLNLNFIHFSCVDLRSNNPFTFLPYHLIPLFPAEETSLKMQTPWTSLCRSLFSHWTGFTPGVTDTKVNETEQTNTKRPQNVQNILALALTAKLPHQPSSRTCQAHIFFSFYWKSREWFMLVLLLQNSSNYQK